MTDEFTDTSKNQKIIDFLKKNSKKIYLFIFIIFTATISYFFIDNFYKKKNIVTSEMFNKANIFILNNKKIEAKKLLLDVLNRKHNFYSPLALNILLENNLIEDFDQIIMYFDLIIKNVDLEKEKNNLFIFKKAIFLSNFDKEDQILSTLKPLIEKNSELKLRSIKLLKEYYSSKGNKQKEEEYSRMLKNN